MSSEKQDREHTEYSKIWLQKYNLHTHIKHQEMLVVVNVRELAVQVKGY